MNRLFKVSTLLVYAAITFTFTSCNDDDDNGGIDYNANVNKNIVTAANPELARLEFPKAKNGKSIILKYYSGDTYGLNYCVEWDTEKKSQRWSCYMMVDHHHSNYDKQHTYKGNAGRYDPNKNPGNHPNERQYPYDPQLPAQYRWSDDLFVHSGYDHGHICPSADRQYSKEANYQTFYMTNMQPQLKEFNQTDYLWEYMEQQVRKWTPNTIGDTLFVCKGGTIDTENQILTRIQGKMIVPKYFYMALLSKKKGQYSALAFWAEHKKTEKSKTHYLRNYVITIDELEARTGIDFFCNLPDGIEHKVESKVAYNYWGIR